MAGGNAHDRRVVRRRDYKGRTLMQAIAEEDEMPPQYAWENTWWGIIVQVILLLVLIIGIPFLIWLLTSQ